MHFLYDNTVEVVPDNWLNDKVCCWPTGISESRRNKLVKKCAEPDEVWPKYQVVIKYSTGK